jgi:hypothetical protein
VRMRVDAPPTPESIARAPGTGPARRRLCLLLLGPDQRSGRACRLQCGPPPAIAWTLCDSW